MTKAALLTIGLLELAWATAILILWFATLRSRANRRRRKASEQAIRPVIDDELSVYLTGGNNFLQIRDLARRERDQVERSILGFHSMLSGDSRDRLTQLAFDLFLVDNWCEAASSPNVCERRDAFSKLAAVAHYAPMRGLAKGSLQKGLHDADAVVRREAAIALTRSGDLEELAGVFQHAITESLLTRAVLGLELRPYAAELCAAVAPQAIRSSATDELLNVLDLMLSWECHLPLTDVRELGNHKDASVRLRTMLLLPVLPATPENRLAVCERLEDRVPAVRAAAVAAADRLNLKTWQFDDAVRAS